MVGLLALATLVGGPCCILGHCSGNKVVSAQASGTGLLLHACLGRAGQVLIEMISAVGLPPLFLGDYVIVY